MVTSIYASGDFSTTKGTGYYDKYSYNASQVNPVYGKSNNIVQPNSIKVRVKTRYK